jgi:2-keto-4-pentenoate hydratase/2-oxohepta-3-ene-1,7-dioic acid hydratase in catechol pathway
MRLLTYEARGQVTYGAVSGNGVVDLGARLGAQFATLRDVIAGDALGRAAELAAKTAPDVALSAIRFLPPVPNAEKILCIGVNYGNRNAEYKDGSDQPKYPSLFPRFPGSLVGHREALIRPPESPQLDYEGEIVIVIGKGGRRIAEESAESHIAGLTIMNEGTIRDWTRHGKFNVTQGKNWDSSGAIGPWLVTADEFENFASLRVTTRVNGEVRQDDTTANLLFPFRYLLRYISTWTTLKPGDVISTGTPVGSGARFDPPRYLQPGDTVEVEVSGIGTLCNTVADEAR